MYLQNVDSMYDMKWDKHVTTASSAIRGRSSTRSTTSSSSNPKIAFELFDTYESECKRLLEARPRAAGVRVCA